MLKLHARLQAVLIRLPVSPQRSILKPGQHRTGEDDDGQVLLSSSVGKTPLDFRESFHSHCQSQIEGGKNAGVCPHPRSSLFLEGNGG